MNRPDCWFFASHRRTHTCSDIVSLHLIWSIQLAWPTTFWKPAFLRQFLVNRCWLKYSKRITVPWQSLIERCVEQASFVIAAELLWIISKSASSNWRVEGKKYSLKCAIEKNVSSNLIEIVRYEFLLSSWILISIEDILREKKTGEKIEWRLDEKANKNYYFDCNILNVASRLESNTLGLEFLFTQRIHRTWFLRNFRIFFFVVCFHNGVFFRSSIPRKNISTRSSNETDLDLKKLLTKRYCSWNETKTIVNS